MSRIPDFDNMLAVLRREKPPRHTLFEFFLNDSLYARLSGERPKERDTLDAYRVRAKAYAEAGYDYVTVNAGFAFPYEPLNSKETYSLNDGVSITTREDFERYPWPDPGKADYSVLERLAPLLPGGMKIMLNGPNGVLENVIRLVGYDNLCFMVHDEPDLARDIFDAVGSRLVGYYTQGMAFDSVGMLMSNDDWGFKTQTLLSPALMREYVFPWHKKIVESAHTAGKPAVLHSCGNLAAVMDDIIDDMRFDGKHSYEDSICPVEEMYDRYHDKIAILGGIDVGFMCSNPPEAIYKRAKALLDRSASDGGYALGTGNSVPDYVPQEAYFAMISAALE